MVFPPAAANWYVYHSQIHAQIHALMHARTHTHSSIDTHTHTHMHEHMYRRQAYVLTHNTCTYMQHEALYWVDMCKFYLVLTDLQGEGAVHQVGHTLSIIQRKLNLTPLGILKDQMYIPTTASHCP